MSNIPKIVADFETSLSGAASIGGEVGVLQSNIDADGNALENGVYAFTVDRDNRARKEHFLCTVDGVNLTNIQSIDRRGNLTTGFAREHRAGANIVISNHSGLVQATRILRGEFGLDGANPIKYETEPTLAEREEIATVGYVLDTATGGEFTISRFAIPGIAGENLTAGEIVVLDLTDLKWYKANATADYSTDNLIGLARATTLVDENVTGGVLIYGTDDARTDLTPGAVYYLSETPGAITTTAPTKVYKIGFARTNASLVINMINISSVPDFINESQIPTPQSAAVGKGVKLESDGKISDSFLRNPKSIVRTYNVAGSPHTWTKPANLQKIHIRAWSGGGSGRIRYTTQGQPAEGGAGGAYWEGFIEVDKLGATETITVGAGGAGFSDLAENGRDGGNTIIGTHITVRGGVGGNSVGANGGGYDSFVNISPLFGVSGQNVGYGFYSGSGGVSSHSGGDSVYGGGGGGEGSQSSSRPAGTSIFAGNGSAGLGTTNSNQSLTTEDAGFPSGGSGGIMARGGGSAVFTVGKGGDGLVIITEFYN